MLEAEGIACNLTLLFGLHQAQACRCQSYFNLTFCRPYFRLVQKAEGVDSYPIEKDPGVVSVKKIYTYYKQQNIPTQVMGASFRSIDQVLGLAGCDLLTISPSLLTQLEQDTRTVDAALDANKAKQAEAIVRPAQDEQSFKDELNHDLMAFQLLQGGVDGFIKARDQLSLLLRQSFGIDAEIKS